MVGFQNIDDFSLYSVWDFRMWPLGILTGFSENKILYGRFACTKIGGQWRGDRIVKVTVRRGSNVTEIKHFVHQICSVFRPTSSWNCESQWIFFIQLFPNGTACNPFTIVTRAQENLIPNLLNLTGSRVKDKRKNSEKEWHFSNCIQVWRKSPEERDICKLLDREIKQGTLKATSPVLPPLIIYPINSAKRLQGFKSQIM